MIVKEKEQFEPLFKKRFHVITAAIVVLMIYQSRLSIEHKTLIELVNVLTLKKILNNRY
jgi:hypothetical protein